MSSAPLRMLGTESLADVPVVATAPIALVEPVERPRAAADAADAQPAGWRPDQAMETLRRQAAGAILGLCSLAGLVLFWHLATRYRWDFYIRFTNLPTPMEVLGVLGHALGSDKFLTNVGMSLRRIFIGFGVAALLGVTLGMLIGRYRLTRQLLFPAFECLRPIPAIAWVPISIMLWPDNEVSIVFITFIGAFFPILLNTVSGVQGVEAVLLRAGQCLGAREWRVMWHIVLPGSGPQIFTGLAVGMGVAWVSLIAAEMISGQFGIGYFPWEAYSLITYPELVLGLITNGVLGLGCSWLIRPAGSLPRP